MDYTAICCGGPYDGETATVKAYQTVLVLPVSLAVSRPRRTVTGWPRATYRVEWSWVDPAGYVWAWPEEGA